MSFPEFAMVLCAMAALFCFIAGDWRHTAWAGLGFLLALLATNL